MTELYRAMISSTTKDMVVHRQQALDVCRSPIPTWSWIGRSRGASRCWRC
jgi:hypothetical protein